MKNTSRTPYIYKVTNLETHQYYIGSQCSGKTIGVNYFTSSTNKAFKDGLCLNKFYCCSKKIFSAVGTHHSEETKQKISTALKGIHRSEETRKKMSVTKKGRPSPKKGIPMSEEHKKKCCLAHKNRIKISIGDNTFDSINAASKYYKVSDTAIRYWLKNKKHNAFYIEKCPKI